MREIRLSGSEGGGTSNRLSLPLSSYARLAAIRRDIPERWLGFELV